MTTANVTETPHGDGEQDIRTDASGQNIHTDASGRNIHTDADTLERTRARQRWMGVLARAGRDALEQAWEGVSPKPVFRHLRVPETGMVMVRGRAGGVGARFNLGEMTMTRCSVSLHGEERAVGHGYVAGRSRRHAELAALFDALLQLDERREELLRTVIEPLAVAHAARCAQEDARTDATKVDFFTMVRGED